ncbi:MAG: hypothetical protein SCH70_09590 [Candidatus Methanoperedens sp.]|nr:hypothetical protein [Candidatus Methanoperedens sp.]
MKDWKLAEKELMILNYFIDCENELIDAEKQINSNFKTYPGKIEKDLEGKISRVHAKVICEKFIEMGILSESRDDRYKKKGEKIYYSISSDLTTFKKIVQLILENVDINSAIKRFGCVFFQSRIDNKLVKNVLIKKGGVLRRKIDISNWEDSEANKLYKDRLKIPIQIDFKINENYDKSIDEYLKEMPDSDIISFEIYIQRKFERLDSKEKITNQFYPYELYLDFPILDLNDGRSTEEHIVEIEALNKKIFEDFPNLKNSFSAISEHYNKWQENNLILPILILIKTSPNALGEFLNGDWAPRDDKFIQDYLIGPYESILEKLLFLTIGDLSTVRSYPKNDMINRISIRPRVLKLNGDEDEELLECTYDGDLRTIYFDTGFLISPNNPGNWKVVDRGHSYSPDILKQLNNIIQHISDFSVILNYLKDSKKPVSIILSKYLSLETKNIIKYCDFSEKIPTNLQIKLKYEIMEALVNEGWNELLTFDFENYVTGVDK